MKIPRIQKSLKKAQGSQSIDKESEKRILNEKIWFKIY